MAQFTEGYTGRIREMGLLGKMFDEDLVFLYGGILDVVMPHRYSLGILTTTRMVNWGATRDDRFSSQGFVIGCPETICWKQHAQPQSKEAQDFVHRLENLIVPELNSNAYKEPSFLSSQ